MGAARLGRSLNQREGDPACALTCKAFAGRSSAGSLEDGPTIFPESLSQVAMQNDVFFPSPLEV
jgi:hypothetical protein